MFLMKGIGRYEYYINTIQKNLNHDMYDLEPFTKIIFQEVNKGIEYGERRTINSLMNFDFEKFPLRKVTKSEIENKEFDNLLSIRLQKSNVMTHDGQFQSRVDYMFSTFKHLKSSIEEIKKYYDINEVTIDISYIGYMRDRLFKIQDNQIKYQGIDNLGKNLDIVHTLIEVKKDEFKINKEIFESIFPNISIEKINKILENVFNSQEEIDNYLDSFENLDELSIDIN